MSSSWEIAYHNLQVRLGELRHALARHRRASRHRYVAAALTSYLLPTRERTAHADARAAGSLSSRLMIYKLLYRIPGGHAVQVFTGVCLVLGIGCAPVLYKKTKAGHDYFSSEKPEAVERGLEAKQKEKYADLIKRNG